ncbi:MAG: type II secretion system F family protein, partial [Candidatus Micrarchaeota archaeon]|nr:type II secretion system F family protein [Candidatus Micrarchaeota archaeon]
MKRLPIISNVSDSMIPYLPGLGRRLAMADDARNPNDFIDWVLECSIGLTLLTTILSLLVVITYGLSLAFPIVTLLITFTLFFYYFFSYPELKIIKKRKDIDNEIIFASKHIIVEISAGVPLFDALVGASDGYGKVSDEIKIIVQKVSFGEPLTHVLRDTAEKTPSQSFRRILVQIANSVVSGANVARSLEATVDQISKEQILEVKEYGQKLNPMIMFYLMIAVIFPSLGMVFVM